MQLVTHMDHTTGRLELNDLDGRLGYDRRFALADLNLGSVQLYLATKIQRPGNEIRFHINALLTCPS